MLSLLALLVSVVLIVGCAKRDANRKETYPVTGTVVVDGKPGDGIQVVLNDVKGIDPNNPSISHTITDPDGKFAISTYEHGDGVPKGEYKLTFFWGAFNPLSMEYGGEDKLKNRYNDPATSTFKINVEKGKPLDLGKIELTTKD